MTKPSAEPREYAIDWNYNNSGQILVHKVNISGEGYSPEAWEEHVIEHSAYAAVCAERDEWKETWAEAIKWKPYLHFCMSAWDGLLIDQTDAEFDACTCFEHKPARRNHDNEIIKETLKLTDEIARLKKQNEVLRAALKRTMEVGCGCFMDCTEQCLEVDLARSQALAEAEGVGE